jgi:hypothetical protein
MPIRAAAQTVVLTALICLAGCAQKEKPPEYTRVRAIPGTVEISFDAPDSADWGRYLTPKPGVKGNWEIEILHLTERLVRIDIRKYSARPGVGGYEYLTPEALIDRSKNLPNTSVGSVKKFKTKRLEFKRFAESGDWVETSGGGPKAPHMRGYTAFFEAKGFLYVISYSAPEDRFKVYLPIFEHLVNTLEMEPDGGRHRAAYKGSRKVLVFNDRPGILAGTALPPPGTPPVRHPFLSGSALYAVEDGNLRAILEQSAGFEDFVNRLKRGGYRVEPEL